MVRIQNITRDIFFFKNNPENEAGRLVPDVFLVFKKALYAFVVLEKGLGIVSPP